MATRVVRGGHRANPYPTYLDDVSGRDLLEPSRQIRRGPTQRPGSASRRDDPHDRVEPPQRTGVQMIGVEMRDQHGVGVQCCGAGNRSPDPAQVRDPGRQHRVGDDPSAAELHGHGRVAPPGDEDRHCHVCANCRGGRGRGSAGTRARRGPTARPRAAVARPRGKPARPRSGRRRVRRANRPIPRTPRPHRSRDRSGRAGPGRPRAGGRPTPAGPLRRAGRTPRSDRRRSRRPHRARSAPASRRRPGSAVSPVRSGP